MTHVQDHGLGLSAPVLSRSGVDGSLVDVADRGRVAFPWRRAAKYAAGLALLAIGGLTTYQNVLVRTSREAVLNGRTVVIRAPMDGMVATTLTAPGAAVQVGTSMGRVEDPRPDDARSFALQQDVAATRRERDALAQRVTDLERARGEAEAQAEAYRLGPVPQDELRREETQARLTPATVPRTQPVATPHP